MRTKTLLLLFTGLTIVILYNSCKKDTQGSIQTLFTTGTWQLASVQVFHYIGSQQISADTLNTDCDLVQNFTFNKNNTCTYTNFDCVAQPIASGNWGLTENKLFLEANMTCKDTTAAGSSKPFANSQIINLGQYSLILQTGDIQPNYSTTKKRTIIRYGFVRQKTN